MSDGDSRVVRQYAISDRDYIALLEACNAELEAAIREMHAAVPRGQMCDPQRVADALRTIADRVGVSIPSIEKG